MVGPNATCGDLAQECRTGADANQREDCRILAVVNGVQAYWSKTLRNYEPTKTRFFDGSIQTGCGPASSATGPFYCPNDAYVYIDLGSSTSCDRNSVPAVDRWPRRTCSRTSTATTSRI